MNKHFLFWILIALLSACKPAGESEESNQPKDNIVCTTSMIADLVRNIVGDEINVKSLMGPGVDPHLYKATQGDLKSLKEAKLIVYNGLHLEGKMTDILEQMGEYRNVIAIEHFVEDSLIIKLDQNANISDPHIWFDVQLWASSIDGFSRELCALFPSHCETIESNSTAYKTELQKLHNWVRQKIEQIPEDQRILITAHDAFEYFGRAYNMEVRGLQGISTLSEFGLKDRVDLVNFIVENKIKAVFVESSVPRKNIEAIVEGCQQKNHSVIIGASLYSDAMGEPGTTEGTYIGMVQHNVQSIVNALTRNTDSYEN